MPPFLSRPAPLSSPLPPEPFSSIVIPPPQSPQESMDFLPVVRDEAWGPTKKERQGESPALREVEIRSLQDKGKFSPTTSSGKQGDLIHAAGERAALRETRH